MRVHLATITTGQWQLVMRQIYADLAATDVVGEHELTASAEHADLIVFVDLHQHIDDPHLRTLRRHPLVRSYPNKIRVIDIRDRPFFTYPGIYISWTAGSRGRDGVAGGCYPNLLTQSGVSDVEPDLLYSFQGARTHPLRSRILDLPRAADTVIEDSTHVNFFHADEDDAGRVAVQQRYREVQARSKFVLCPRGHGPSSFRIFETMSAGRVPVIISDRWLPPPGVDWDSCSIRVAETDLGNLRGRLASVDARRWAELASGARLAWATLFDEGHRWHHYIETLAAVDTQLPLPLLQRERLRVAVHEARRRAKTLVPGLRARAGLS